MSGVYDECPKCGKYRVMSFRGNQLVRLACESGCVPIHVGGERDGMSLKLPLNTDEFRFYGYEDDPLDVRYVCPRDGRTLRSYSEDPRWLECADCYYMTEVPA